MITITTNQNMDVDVFLFFFVVFFFLVFVVLVLVFFFFQAEDGIRDVAVTGVQTCALPIYDLGRRSGHLGTGARQSLLHLRLGGFACGIDRLQRAHRKR